MVLSQGNEPGVLPRRLRREWKTVRVMIAMYCRGHHQPPGRLCSECQELFAYAERRLRGCRFGRDKPTCLRCPVHCYKPEMREKIRQVMRFSGPRLLWTHPLLALMHLFDGRKQPGT
jgi:hypothetical protein